MTPADTAAWVQAVGSIAAIGVAIWVANRQFSDALNLQRRSSNAGQRQKLDALLGLVDGAASEFADIAKALRGADPQAWFEANSGTELMADMNDVFKQITPLDMPSAAAAKALIKLRDLFSTAAWNANEALRRGTSDYAEYVACVEAMEDNLRGVQGERERLKSEFDQLQLE